MSTTSQSSSPIAPPLNIPPFPTANGELVTLKVDLASAIDHRDATTAFSRTLRSATLEFNHCVRLRERFDTAIENLRQGRDLERYIPIVLNAAEVITLVLAHFDTAANHLKGANQVRAQRFEATGYALLRVVAIHAPVTFSRMAGRV